MPLNPGAVNNAYIKACSDGADFRVRVKVAGNVFVISGMDYHAGYNSCLIKREVDGSNVRKYFLAGRVSERYVDYSSSDYVDIDEWPEYSMQREAARSRKGEITAIDLRHVFAV